MDLGRGASVPFAVRGKTIAEGGIVTCTSDPASPAERASLADRTRAPQSQLVVPKSIRSGSGRPMRPHASRIIWSTSCSQAWRLRGIFAVGLGKSVQDDRRYRSPRLGPADTRSPAVHCSGRSVARCSSQSRFCTSHRRADRARVSTCSGLSDPSTSKLPSTRPRSAGGRIGGKRARRRADGRRRVRGPTKGSGTNARWPLPSRSGCPSGRVSAHPAWHGLRRSLMIVARSAFVTASVETTGQSSARDLRQNQYVAIEQLLAEPQVQAHRCGAAIPRPKADRRPDRGT